MKGLGIEPITEFVDYLCGNCGSSHWIIKIGHRSDGKTFLETICANPECTAQRRQELGVEADALIVWDELDITGQGHDARDVEECTEVN